MNKKFEEFVNRQKTSKIFNNVDPETFAGKAIIACRAKLQGSLGDNGFLLMNLLDIVELMFLHDKFQSMGIIITPENKEDKIIEIIEKNDENLLNDLEKYLNLYDKLFELIFQKDQYQKIVDEISLCDSNDQNKILDIVKPFLKHEDPHFQSQF